MPTSGLRRSRRLERVSQDIFESESAPVLFKFKPMSDLPAYVDGHCHCGKTRFRLSLTDIESDLALSAFCHCTKCQRLNGAPFVWTTHWEKEAVEWIETVESGSSDSPTSTQSQSPLRSLGGAQLIPLDETKPSIPSARYTASMVAYETMQGRKWKQRCAACGTPMGSWNEAKMR